MSESELKLLQEVKEFMKEQEIFYRTNKRYAVAHAIKLLISDITERFECEWMCGYE